MSVSEESVSPSQRVVDSLQDLYRRADRPTLREVARRIRVADRSTTVSISTVSDVLRGRRLPSWRVARELAQALGADEREINELHDLWQQEQEARSVSSAERVNEEFVTRYLRQAIAFAGQLRLPSLTVAERASFDDLYIEQRVADIHTGETQSIWSMDNEIRRAVLLGSPGVGKTTASHALMYRHARERVRRIPFLITIREFFSTLPPERSVIGVIEHIAETFFQVQPPDGYIKDLLLHGNALVIFDGLDELPVEAARATSSIIELFCEEFPEAQIVVTSRPVGYAQASLNPDRFRLYVLDGFSQAQIYEYLHKWFGLRAELTETEREAYIQHWLSVSESIADLYSNPLFLSLAGQLYYQGAVVPTNLIDLIRGMSELMLDQWDRIRGIDPVNPALAYAAPILDYLGFQMLDKYSNRITERELIHELIGFLEAGPASVTEANAIAQAFLNLIRNRSLMLSEVGVTPAGESIFMFTYRTFMEFFAARYLAATRNPAELITERLSEPEWQTTLGFVLSLLEQTAPERAEELLTNVGQQAQSMPGQIGEWFSRYLARRQFMNLMADLSKNQQQLVEAIQVIGERVEDIGREAGAVPERIAESDSRGGGEQGRLAVTNQFVSKLDEIVAKLEEAVNSYEIAMAPVSAGILAVIEHLEENPSELASMMTLARLLRQLVERVHESVESQQDLDASVSRAAEASSAMREPVRRISGAIGRFVAATQSIDESDRRLQALGVDIPSTDWEPPNSRD
jgi:methyl-accepting chemotaxis protein